MPKNYIGIRLIPEVASMVKLIGRNQTSGMSENLKRTIGARLKVARTARGLTQERLAENIGKTEETVSNIERGKSLPSIETMLDICSVLGLELGELFAQAARPVTGSRAQAEASAIHLIRNLGDDDLGIAVKQLEALAARQKR